MQLYNDLLKEYKNGLFGYATIAIIAQSCIGSMAAMLILMSGYDSWQMIQLTIVTLACMFYNGAILSQQSPKLSLNLLIASVAISLLFIIANF